MHQDQEQMFQDQVRQMVQVSFYHYAEEAVCFFLDSVLSCFFLVKETNVLICLLLGFSSLNDAEVEAM
jgi:hypothetical protein